MSYASSDNAVSNWKSSSELQSPGILSTWVWCWLEGELMQIFQSILLWIANFHCTLFFLAVNLEDTIFLQSRGSYSQQNVISELLQKRKWKLKIALAAVSDPAVWVSLT